MNLIKKLMKKKNFQRHKDNNNRRENSLPPVSGPKPNSNTNSYNGYQASNSNKNQNGNKVNVDKDESGFYKARQNNDHAKTVPDNHNMYVDMPADYKKTKQVVHVCLIILFPFIS